MKKKCALILIIVCLMSMTLCGCESGENWTWGEKISPWGSKNIQNTSGEGAKKTYRIYVCGAVENEGYYELSEDATYLDAVLKAGRLDCSYLRDNANLLVNGSQSAIIVQYVADGKVYDCYNVNWEYFSLRLPTVGLSNAVVNKIADYLDKHGKIANKTVLLEILGAEDYANNHYKLYVAEADYEEAD